MVVYARVLADRSDKCTDMKYEPTFNNRHEARAHFLDFENQLLHVKRPAWIRLARAMLCICLALAC